MNKYTVEFIGTFFLVLTIGCAVIGGTPGVIPPLAIGSILVVMIYAGGHISGAHFNPAVTLGVWIRGRCKSGDVAPYMIAQIAGAALAAMVVKFLLPESPITPRDPDPIRALLAEFLFTFALVYVVLNVATAKAHPNNSFYGLAIGFTVMAGAFSVSKISAGAFNPAVAVGALLLGLVTPSSFWIFPVANFAGGVVAGLAFKALNPTDK